MGGPSVGDRMGAGDTMRYLGYRYTKVPKEGGVILIPVCLLANRKRGNRHGPFPFIIDLGFTPLLPTTSPFHGSLFVQFGKGLLVQPKSPFARLNGTVAMLTPAFRECWVTANGLDGHLQPQPNLQERLYRLDFSSKHSSPAFLKISRKLSLKRCVSSSGFFQLERF